MSHRHLSRSVVLQTLFEWDFALSNRVDEKKSGSINIDEALERNVDEFAPGSKDKHFMKELLKMLTKL